MGGELPTSCSASANGWGASSYIAGWRLIWLSRIARPTTSRSWTRSSGLSKYSKAPSFIASIAVSVVPCAVMTMTGTRASIRRMFWYASSPDMSGSRTSRITASGGAARTASMPFRAVSARSHLQPRALQYLFQGIAYVRLVVDDQEFRHGCTIPYAPTAANAGSRTVNTAPPSLPFRTEISPP